MATCRHLNVPNQVNFLTHSGTLDDYELCLLNMSIHFLRKITNSHLSLKISVARAFRNCTW